MVNGKSDFVHGYKAFSVHPNFSDNFSCPSVPNDRNLVCEDEKALFDSSFESEWECISESPHGAPDKDMVVFALLAPLGLMCSITIGSNRLATVFTTHVIPLVCPALFTGFTIIRWFSPITADFHD